MSNTRITAAERLARNLSAEPWTPVARDGTTNRRWFIMGDPQAPLPRLFELLDRHELLSENGRLRSDVGLVSIGDHFDFHAAPETDVTGHGLAFLRWLADHAPDQVVILAGNHDFARVIELAFETDASFAAAQALALQASNSSLKEEFCRKHPRIATATFAARDYAQFRVEQRNLVQRLLLANRMRLATTARLPSNDVALVTHAGVTLREVGMLPGEVRPEPLARALDAHLRAAVDRVRAEWLAGENAALDLSPLYIAASSGAEGGGLGYHRPANSARPGADTAWETDRERPRRFHPADLPVDLLQIVGHTSHQRLHSELTPWSLDGAVDPIDSGRVRTLRVSNGSPCYTVGQHAHVAGNATMLFVDVKLSDPEIREPELLPVASVDP